MTDDKKIIFSMVGVSKTYPPHKQVLKDIYLSFFYGAKIGIIGLNGSGKSTLLSLMAGLTLPKSGDILYEGESIFKINLEEYRRNKASVIYQTFNLFPLMTVLENVIFPLELKGMKHSEAREIAVKYIESVGLSKDHCKRFPHMLSGGERQRVAIARALATGSKLLLADEPTGSLDVANGEIVVKLLTDLAHKENLAVVIVTHDLSIAEKADVVYRMQDGMILVPDTVNIL